MSVIHGPSVRLRGRNHRAAQKLCKPCAAWVAKSVQLDFQGIRLGAIVRRLTRAACALTVAAAVAGVAAWRQVPTAAQVAPNPVAIDSDDIGGVVSGPRDRRLGSG